MTEQRQELINRFQKWLDTNPRKQIIAAQCANIAEEYAAEQLKLYGVVGRSEQFICGAERVHGEKRCNQQCSICMEEYGKSK